MQSLQNKMRVVKTPSEVSVASSALDQVKSQGPYSSKSDVGALLSSCCVHRQLLLWAAAMNKTLGIFRHKRPERACGHKSFQGWPKEGSPWPVCKHIRCIDHHKSIMSKCNAIVGNIEHTWSKLKVRTTKQTSTWQNIMWRKCKLVSK